MKNFIIASCLFASLSTATKAQFTIVTNEVTQVPLTGLPTLNDDTTPYLYNETFNGSVILADGKSVNNLNILYDLKKDMPIVVTDKGTFVKFNISPKQFELVNPKIGKQVFRLGYPVKPEGYLEVLADGNYQLLKKISKSFAETSVFSTGRVEKKAVFSEVYYLYDGDKMIKIKKDPQSLIAELPSSKRQELSQYYSQLKKNPDNKLTAEEMLISIAEKSNVVIK